MSSVFLSLVCFDAINTCCNDEIDWDERVKYVFYCCSYRTPAEIILLGDNRYGHSIVSGFGACNCMIEIGIIIIFADDFSVCILYMTVGFHGMLGVYGDINDRVAIFSYITIAFLEPCVVTAFHKDFEIVAVIKSMLLNANFQTDYIPNNDAHAKSERNRESDGDGFDKQLIITFNFDFLFFVKNEKALLAERFANEQRVENVAHRKADNRKYQSAAKPLLKCQTPICVLDQRDQRQTEGDQKNVKKGYFYSGAYGLRVECVNPFGVGIVILIRKDPCIDGKAYLTDLACNAESGCKTKGKQALMKSRVGYHGGKDISLRFDTTHEKEMAVFGSNSTAMSSWEISMKLMNEKKVNLSPFVSMKLPLSEWKRGFNAVINKEAYKVVFCPDLDNQK